MISRYLIFHVLSWFLDSTRVQCVVSGVSCGFCTVVTAVSPLLVEKRKKGIDCKFKLLVEKRINCKFKGCCLHKLTVHRRQNRCCCVRVQLCFLPGTNAQLVLPSTNPCVNCRSVDHADRIAKEPDSALDSCNLCQCLQRVREGTVTLAKRIDRLPCLVDFVSKLFVHIRVQSRVGRP